MRRLCRITAMCMAMLLMCAPVLAEAPFLRHAADWMLERIPLEVTLSADVVVHMPFDDDRMAMLQPIINQLSLRLNTVQDAGSVTIRVGQSDALTLSYQGEDVQLSTMPGITYTSEEDATDKLLGGSTSLPTTGISAEGEKFLEDGWILLTAISPALDAYADRRSVKTNITDMGTARSCTDYTIPKAEAEKIPEMLEVLCPDGRLKEIISNLQFSGKQTLRVYRTAEEIPLRMEYNGACGVDGDLRTVKLVWRMRRDDVAHRDELTLTSPAKSGSNKNTLEFERVIKTNKSGAVTMEGSYTYTVTANKQTTTRKGSFDLINAFTENADVISGSFTLQEKLPGESAFAGITITPEITISGSADEPLITGVVGVKELSGKNVLEQANIHVHLQRGMGVQWESWDAKVDLDAITPDELAQIQSQAAASAATALVKRLILVMGDSADWFFRDLPADAVERIVDAADSVVVIE